MKQQQTEELQELSARNDEVLKARLSEQKRLIDEGHLQQAKQTQAEIRILRKENQEKDVEFLETIRVMQKATDEANKLNYAQMEELRSDFHEKMVEAENRVDELKAKYK